MGAQSPASVHGDSGQSKSHPIWSADNNHSIRQHTVHMPWTSHDMPLLAGRTAVVTGANSGIGFATACALATHGADVTLAVRDLAKGEAAATRMRDQGASAVLVRRLDLADLACVHEFAEQWGNEHPDGLDLLVNNAGVMAIPRELTVDGFERQLATNYLGHYALTGLLLPALLAQPQSRIVCLSSNAHRSAKRINFDDLMGARRYSAWGAYAQSKLALLLFTSELQHRLHRIGSSTKAMAAHPGLSASNLFSGILNVGKVPVLGTGVGLLSAAVGQSASMGALPVLFAATAPDVAGDSYIGPDGPGQLRGYPQLVDRSAAAMNIEAAQRLWLVSQELTHVTIPVD